MSTSSYWDPVSEQFIHYDYSRASWAYPDGSLFDPTATSRQATSIASPRSTHDAADEQSLQSQQKQPWLSSSSFGSSPRNSSYTYDPDATEELASSLANTRLGGTSSSAAGDETPTPRGTVHFGYVEREPKEEVTDPALYEKGYVSRGRIRATPGEKEALDADFKRQPNPKRFFVPGKIFRILWPEHPGYQSGGNVTVVTDPKFPETTYITKFRWFVVVKEGTNFCSCLPISTYGRRGVSKPSLHKWQHSVIYSGRSEPDLKPGEEPGEGEEGMMKAIRATGKRRSDKLDGASRIDYSRIYTVDHYVKVKEFGDVIEADVKRLRRQWWIVFKKNIEEDALDDQEETDDSSQDLEETDDENAHDESEYLEWVTAKYAYNDPKMMKLQAGDRIGVLEVVTDHWWKGRNLRTNEVNVFPAQYVDRTSQ